MLTLTSLRIILMIKLLSLFDWTLHIILTFPLVSLFLPHCVRILLVKTVVCFKVYLIGFVCCLTQLFGWDRLECSPLIFDTDTNRRPLAIVTGATSGIGLALCQLLALSNWRLVIIGRDRSHGARAIERLKHRYDDKCQIDFYQVDLSSRQSINEFLEIFISKFDRVHLLVNNAGIMMPPYKAVGTSGDIEYQWAVNFLAPIYMADRLRPCLQRAIRYDGFGRIVNVSSAVLYAGSLSSEYFASAGGCNGSPNRYSSHLAYANSKLALSLFTQDPVHHEEQEDEKITVCSVHPGVVATNLYENTNFILKWFVRGKFQFIRNWVVLTPEQAADSLLWACLSPSVENGGFYENGHRLRLPVVDERIIMAMWIHLEKQDIVTKPRNMINNGR